MNQERRSAYASEQEPRHNCGIAGIYGVSLDVTAYTISMLESLQSRGQEGAGIWVNNGQEGRGHKGAGWARQVFANNEVVGYLRKIHPHVAIGQDRYSTSGSLEAWQPFVEGGLALVHNGNLTNARELYAQLPSHVQEKAQSDSWIAHQTILRSEGDSWEEKIRRAVSQFEGAYNLILEAEGKMYAVRDFKGYRPLVIGEVQEKKAVAVASETSAFTPLGLRYMREVHEGEGVVIDEHGAKTFFVDERTDIQKAAHCIFEFVYFSAPDSIIFAKPVSHVRYECGRMLARSDAERRFLPDRVIPVQQSGVTYAQGYSEEMVRQVCKNPYRFNLSWQDVPGTAAALVPKTGLVTNPYVGRVFIENSGREEKSSIKHRANAGDNPERKVVVVDDSIVRSNAIKQVVGALREQPSLLGVAPPAEIHARIGSPPIMHPCYMGIDFSTQKELIAYRYNGDVEEIRKSLGGVDSLRYVTHRQLVASVVGEERIKDIPDHELFEKTGHCGACFNGTYPQRIKGVFSKNGT